MLRVRTALLESKNVLLPSGMALLVTSWVGGW